MRALSIRQPWAWLIANGFKDVENRTWTSSFIGPCLIHASGTLTRYDYENCVKFLKSNVRLWQALEQLLRNFDREYGGIIGAMTITGCVNKSGSPWFVGPYAFTIEGAHPLPFRPLRGALKFFNCP